MSRRVTSPQALDAWVIIRDALDHPDYCLHDYDNEHTTISKLEKLSNIRNAINVLGSFIANPDRETNTQGVNICKKIIDRIFSDLPKDGT